MLNDVFNFVRDAKREYKELNVTENRIGEAIQLNDRVANVRIDTNGLEGTDTKLSIRFYLSKDGVSFYEIGTFPIPDEHHGVVFPMFNDWVKYELFVNGSSPNLDLSIKF